MPISTLEPNALASGAVTRPKIGYAGAVLQVSYKLFSDTTTITSGANTYQSVTNGTLAITSTAANSRFLVRMVAQGYQSGGSGSNIGMSRTIGGTTTRLLGTDGTSGNSWMGIGNGTSTTSFTIVREFLDSPAQPAGTTITYNMLAAFWSSTGGLYIGYPGYSPENTISIQEIAG